MIIAGLTGTIGTGKSAVSNMFRELGAVIIDADKLSHEVVEPGKKAWKEIIDNFGREVLNDDQTINRQKLADIVFSNKEKLQILNSIVHPAVLAEDARLVEEQRGKNPQGLVINDIPLLFELGPELMSQLADIIIVVYCSPEVQLKRLIDRGMTEADALNRIKSQIPIQENLKSADFVINNDGTPEETRQQVRQIYNTLMKKDR